MPNAKIAELDKNMAAKDAADNLKWLPAASAPLEVAALPFLRQCGVYRRLPPDPTPAEPNEGVKHLAWHTSGAVIRFRSNTARVSIRLKSQYGELMDHMPQTGILGCDFYAGDPLRFFGASRYPVGQTEYSVELFNANSTGTMRSFEINLPLYGGVASCEVGFDPNAVVDPPFPRRRQGSIVWYGTSIQQGGCASRPGMGMTNQISRRLDMDIVNLGFSGSGRGESAIAHLMLQVPDPAMFVLDYDANVDKLADLVSTLPALIDILRASHPTLPIIVISRVRSSRDAFPEIPPTSPDQGSRELRAAAQAAEVARRRASGDLHIHFIDGGSLLGDDFDECTVDGLHPTDLGFYRIASALTPQLIQLLP